VVTHSPLTPTARVQLVVALSSSTQAIILHGSMKCVAISKQWVNAAEDCGCKLPGVCALAGIKREGGR